MRSESPLGYNRSVLGWNAMKIATISQHWHGVLDSRSAAIQDEMCPPVPGVQRTADKRGKTMRRGKHEQFDPISAMFSLLSVGLLCVSSCGSRPHALGIETENAAYTYADSLVGQVPSNLVVTDNAKSASVGYSEHSVAKIYHDPTVVVDDSNPTNLRATAGAGRAIMLLRVPDKINAVAAVYLDAMEYRSYESTQNPDKLVRNIAFLSMWMNPKLSDHRVERMVLLNKGKYFVMYVRKDNRWKRGAFTIDKMDAEANALAESGNGTEVAAEQTTRYLDLAERLKATYMDAAKEPVSRSKNQEAMETLAIELRNGDSDASEAATQAFLNAGELGVEPLIRLLRDDTLEETERRNVIYVLGKIGDSRAVQPLIETLEPV